MCRHSSSDRVRQAQFVTEVLHPDRAVGADDREDFAENGFEADRLALVRQRIRLQKSPVRRNLQFGQVGRFNRVADFAEIPDLHQHLNDDGP